MFGFPPLAVHKNCTKRITVCISPNIIRRFRSRIRWLTAIQRWQIHVTMFVYHFKGRDRLGDLGTDIRIILNGNFRTSVWEQVRVWSAAEFCEHGDEPGVAKGLSVWQRGSAPLVYWWDAKGSVPVDRGAGREVSKLEKVRICRQPVCYMSRSCNAAIRIPKHSQCCIAGNFSIYY